MSWYYPKRNAFSQAKDNRGDSARGEQRDRSGLGDGMSVHRLVNLVGDQRHALVVGVSPTAKVRLVGIDPAQVDEEPLTGILGDDLLFDSVDDRICAQYLTGEEDVRITALLQSRYEGLNSVLQNVGVERAHIDILAELQDNEVWLPVDLRLELRVVVRLVAPFEIITDIDVVGVVDAARKDRTVGGTGDCRIGRIDPKVSAGPRVDGTRQDMGVIFLQRAGRHSPIVVPTDAWVRRVHRDAVAEKQDAVGLHVAPGDVGAAGLKGAAQTEDHRHLHAKFSKHTVAAHAEPRYSCVP